MKATTYEIRKHLINFYTNSVVTDSVEISRRAQMNTFSNILNILNDHLFTGFELDCSSYRYDNFFNNYTGYVLLYIKDNKYYLIDDDMNNVGDFCDYLKKKLTQDHFPTDNIFRVTFEDCENPEQIINRI